MSKRHELIPYNLPNGKTVWLTFDQIDNIDIQELMALDAGDYIDDPFTDSSLVGKRMFDDYPDEFLMGFPEEDIDLSYDPED